MDSNKVLYIAQRIVEASGYDQKDIKPENFLEYSRFVTDIIMHYWSQKQRETCAWLPEWLEGWKKLCGEFDTIYKADPMILYKPRNPTSESFHKSDAFIRYFRAGNRTSKTQSGYAEHYFYGTSNHPYRSIPGGPTSTFIVAGLPFTTYVPNVFEKKFITGEPGNILAPMFPEGGKWLHRYDKRTRRVILKCADCANGPRTLDCPGHHRKSSITLFSHENGHEVLEAFSGILAHFDEHVEYPFYTATKQRLMDTDGSRLIVTGTPLHGPESWETRMLAKVALGNPKENVVAMGDGSSMEFVSLHQCSQYDGNVVPKWKTDIEAKTLDEMERRARIDGIPAPLADVPVFDRNLLAQQQERFGRTPRYVDLQLNFDNYAELSVESAMYQNDIVSKDLNFTEKNTDVSTWTGWRIWEHPEPTSTYIIAVDSSAGLAQETRARAGDACCASVLKIIDNEGDIALHLVAQFWGWINLLDYPVEVKKGGTYYNNALAIIELTGGYGRGVMLRLKRELGYFNIYRDATKPEQVDIHPDSRHGVDTNKSTKPIMVAALQQLIMQDKIIIPCADTIRELSAFGQEDTDSGIGRRYRGMGEKDDRVMTLCIGSYCAMTAPVLYLSNNLYMKRPTDGIVTRQQEYWNQVRDGATTDSQTPFN